MGAHSCSKKKIYYSKSEAAEAADEAMEKYCSVQYPYNCPVCGLFHLTRINPRAYETVVRWKREMAEKGIGV